MEICNKFKENCQANYIFEAEIEKAFGFFYIGSYDEIQKSTILKEFIKVKSEFGTKKGRENKQNKKYESSFVN